MFIMHLSCLEEYIPTDMTLLEALFRKEQCNIFFNCVNLFNDNPGLTNYRILAQQKTLA